MKPNPPREHESGRPRSDRRPSTEALRKWVDSRNPRKSKGRPQKERDVAKSELDKGVALRERVEEWGTILLVLGVLIVWARLLLAARGIFPLF